MTYSQGQEAGEMANRLRRFRTANKLRLYVILSIREEARNFGGPVWGISLIKANNHEGIGSNYESAPLPIPLDATEEDIQAKMLLLG